MACIRESSVEQSWSQLAPDIQNHIDGFSALRAMGAMGSGSFSNMLLESLPLAEAMAHQEEITNKFCPLPHHSVIDLFLRPGNAAHPGPIRITLLALGDNLFEISVRTPGESSPSAREVARYWFSLAKTITFLQEFPRDSFDTIAHVSSEKGQAGTP